ncbi:MAG: DUF4312 family protein [Sporolactobacillus sp.]|nr:DUF4312 family protein [Sporolactobacillus sp.]MCI1880707.1 DUF4312 family protein [Sporolactobacillus sp.]
MKQSNDFVTRTVRVVGRAEEKQQAFANALFKIKNRVIKNEHQIILQIIPEQVHVVAASKEAYKEKFLLFFFPRIRKIYQVTLDVEVRIHFLNIDQVVFTSAQQVFPHQFSFMTIRKMLRGEK